MPGGRFARKNDPATAATATISLEKAPLQDKPTDTSPETPAIKKSENHKQREAGAKQKPYNLNNTKKEARV